MADSFKCPKCGMVSWNPNDVRERYCGNCHAFMVTDEVFQKLADTQGRKQNVYRDGKVHVASEKCEQCLFTPKRLVSGAHAAEIVRKTTGPDSEAGSAFNCHKGTIADKDAICAGWYEKFGDKDPILIMAEKLGAIERQDMNNL